MCANDPIGNYLGSENEYILLTETVICPFYTSTENTVESLQVL